MGLGPVELIGIGIDLVDIARVERMLERHGERVLVRFLTPRERAYVVGRVRPAMHIAARIAAKEAAYKALQALPGARAVGWHDLEVERETEGRPYFTLAGLALELATKHTLSIQLSLSHSDATAGAVAVAVTP
jgi:holo-[acyl-carrier protein] synthase